MLDLKQYPQVVPFIESIRATLAGDRAALEQIFKVDFEGSFEHWTLELVPLDASSPHASRRSASREKRIPSTPSRSARRMAIARC